jgi:hypothetical protein
LQGFIHPATRLVSMAFLDQTLRILFGRASFIAGVVCGFAGRSKTIKDPHQITS